MIGKISAIFIDLAEKLENQFEFLRTYLQTGNINIPLIVYISLTITSCIISFIASLIASVTFLPIFIKNPILLIPLTALSPFLISMVVFVFFIFYPINKASGRKVSIENVLPFAIIHMASIARSGVPPYIIFKLISRFKEYGELAVEFDRVVRNMENYGMDFATALKNIADKTPSDALRETLNGFATTVLAGGDIKSYLSYIAERNLAEWRGKRQRYINKLTTFAEIYIGLVLSSPLFLVALLSIMGLVSPKLGGFTITQLAKFSIYIVVPAVNLIFLAFLKVTEIEI